jgi:hypothetical protein
MPYEMLEELRSRSKEKVATFLTFENIVAILIGVGPIFLISGNWPLIPRVTALLVAGLCGYILTLDVRGMPLYEQILWAVRGMVRLRLQGDLISPDQLGQSPVAHETDMPLPVDGPVRHVTRAASYRPLAAPERAPSPDASRRVA